MGESQTGSGSEPPGEGLEVALLPLIPGFPHLPSRPWGRGSVVSRVVWARQARKGWGDPPLRDPTSARGWLGGKRA